MVKILKDPELKGDRRSDERRAAINKAAANRRAKQAQVEAPAPAVPGAGGIKGKRPSKKDKLRAAQAQADALAARKPV